VRGPARAAGRPPGAGAVRGAEHRPGALAEPALAGVEGGEAGLLGALKAFCDRLQELAELFARPHGAEAWRRHLNQALEQLLEAGDDDIPPPGFRGVREPRASQRAICKPEWWMFRSGSTH
jgi:hypothetical protein